AISARCRGYFVGRCLEGRRLGRIVLPRPGGLGDFRRCFGGSAASENGASIGWQACLRGVKNVTRCDAGADRCTISTAEVLIVARYGPGRGFVTVCKPSRD